jgi:predicted Zn-dependent peptidase
MHGLAAIALLTQAAFGADTLRTPGGPEALWSRAPGPLVALHLSVPLPRDLPTGAAALLQELARPAAEEAAHRSGATLRLTASDDEATFAVTGPTTAFDALVGVLRAATSPDPDLTAASLRAARARAEDRVLASLEQPVPRLRALLRARLLGAAASGPALERIDPEAVRALARRLYDPGKLRLVLVGGPPPEVVRSALAGWARGALPTAAPSGSSAGPAGVDGEHVPLPRPQAHHAWVATAFAAGPGALDVTADRGVLDVAAALVARRLAAAGVRSGAAEGWLLDGRGVLVVLGGAARDDPDVTGAARITAFPAGADADVPALARFLRRMVAEAAALVSPAAVDDVATELRRRRLMDARTVTGRAALLAAAWGAGSAAEWAAWQAPAPAEHIVLGRHDRVRYEQVRALLEATLEARPVLVEVRP